MSIAQDIGLVEIGFVFVFAGVGAKDVLGVGFIAGIDIVFNASFHSFLKSQGFHAHQGPIGITLGVIFFGNRNIVVGGKGAVGDRAARGCHIAHITAITVF